MPCPLKICFTNKVNTIYGGGQLLVTGSQGPITRVPGVRIPSPRVPFPESQGPKSQGPKVSGPRGSGLRIPGLRVLGLRYQGPGSRVSGPDFRLCPQKSVQKVFLFFVSFLWYLISS